MTRNTNFIFFIYFNSDQAVFVEQLNLDFSREGNPTANRIPFYVWVTLEMYI